MVTEFVTNFVTKFDFFLLTQNLKERRTRTRTRTKTRTTQTRTKQDENKKLRHKLKRKKIKLDRLEPVTRVEALILDEVFTILVKHLQIIQFL